MQFKRRFIRITCTSIPAVCCWLVLALTACTANHSPRSGPDRGIEKPQADASQMEKSFVEWWAYHCSHIVLSSDFVGFDQSLDSLSKGDFLQKLTTGNFIPIQMAIGGNHYRLYKLTDQADPNIGSTIKSAASTALKHFNLEGTVFPPFSFTDLEGNQYTNQSTKGKELIIKTWFIHCVACVAEFPELNALFTKYHQKEGVLFLGLALDGKEELLPFLENKAFAYQVVPDQSEFINQLGLQIYPTHLVIDEQGIIKKIFNKASEMIAYVEGKQMVTP